MYRGVGWKLEYRQAGNGWACCPEENGRGWERKWTYAQFQPPNDWWTKLQWAVTTSGNHAHWTTSLLVTQRPPPAHEVVVQSWPMYIHISQLHNYLLCIQSDSLHTDWDLGGSSQIHIPFVLSLLQQRQWGETSGLLERAKEAQSKALPILTLKDKTLPVALFTCIWGRHNLPTHTLGGPWLAFLWIYHLCLLSSELIQSAQVAPKAQIPRWNSVLEMNWVWSILYKVWVVGVLCILYWDWYLLRLHHSLRAKLHVRLDNDQNYRCML